MKAAPSTRFHLMGQLRHDRGVVDPRRQGRQGTTTAAGGFCGPDPGRSLAVGLRRHGEGAEPQGLLQSLGPSSCRSRSRAGFSIHPRSRRRHALSMGVRRLLLGRFLRSGRRRSAALRRDRQMRDRGTCRRVFREMLEKTGNYGFEAGKVYNLESSRFIAKERGCPARIRTSTVPRSRTRSGRRHWSRETLDDDQRDRPRPRDSDPMNSRFPSGSRRIPARCCRD